jgi:molybdopterin molybdotransferase
MISVKSIDAHLSRLAQPVESTLRPLGEAVGRCLREPLVAKRPAPPFDRVMMDGYALNAATLGSSQRRFCIVGSAPAGSEPPRLAGKTCAVEVMTGAMLPPGADCVVPVEVCRVQGDTLEITADAPLDVGQFIHTCGSDYAEGAQVLLPGVRLHPAHLALAASEGYQAMSVNTELGVHLITTGDEIIEAGSQPLPWQIFGTHATLIQAALQRMGDVRLCHQHVRDKQAALLAAIEACSPQADVVILCGAMSKGRKDYGIEAVKQAGFEVVFHRVAQRPGHPMALAQRGRTLLFGLPGNPLAVLFTFYRHVLPALDRLRGFEPTQPLQVPVAGQVSALSEATRFVPCRLESGQAIPCLPHNSGDLQCLAHTDGFVEIPPMVMSDKLPEPVALWRWT